MDNLFSGSASLFSLPLPLSGGSSEAPRPVLKSTSLSRLDELQQYLRQCDDQQYLRKYYKMLSSCPTDVLDDYAKQLKNRAAWLATEEEREYKRAKLLNVMGNPLVAPASAVDADAFCTKVLEEEFPEEDCVTPNNPRAASRLVGLPSIAGQDGGSGAAQPAVLATGSSQQQQQQQAAQWQRYGGGGFDASAVAGPPPSHFKLEGTADLFSPLAHIGMMDHHIQRLLSPLPSLLSPNKPSTSGTRMLALQTQLDPKRL